MLLPPAQTVDSCINILLILAKLLIGRWALWCQNLSLICMIVYDFYYWLLSFLATSSSTGYGRAWYYFAAPIYWHLPPHTPCIQMLRWSDAQKGNALHWHTFCICSFAGATWCRHLRSRIGTYCPRPSWGDCRRRRYRLQRFWIFSRWGIDWSGRPAIKSMAAIEVLYLSQRADELLQDDGWPHFFLMLQLPPWDTNFLEDGGNGGRCDDEEEAEDDSFRVRNMDHLPRWRCYFGCFHVVKGPNA